MKTKFLHYSVMCVFLVLLTSSKCVRIQYQPQAPKQGDNMTFQISANESNNLVKVDYIIGSITGTTTTVPKTIMLNTCKSSGVYYKTISYSAKAYYKDGTIKTTNGEIDLTIGHSSRDDFDNTYVTYVSDDNDGTINDVWCGWANAFQDEFNSYSQTQYYWSEPRFFSSESINFANSADMAVFIGHGCPHQILAGPSSSDWVDISGNSFGMFVPCNQVGDLKYLVSGSCQLLSLDDIGSNSWDYFWVNNGTTKLENRPFSGLHLVCGFRTNHHFTYWWWFGWHSSSSGFFGDFAASLNDKETIRDSWLNAAGDDLSFDDGNNRAAVFYLKPYENDIITSNHTDNYIYGNSNYNLWAEYWD